MQIKKIKAAAYAIGKRLQGEQLLKNPKGTPGTVVKTLRHLEYIESSTLDIGGEYITTFKDFSKRKNPKITKYLFFNKYAFFNEKTKKLDRKKHLDFLQTSSNSDKNLYKWKETGIVPVETLNERNLEPLQQVVSQTIEEYIDFSMAFIGAFSVKEETVKKTFADIAVEQYNKIKNKKLQNEYQKPSFWKTLFHNLSQ